MPSTLVQQQQGGRGHLQGLPGGTIGRTMNLDHLMSPRSSMSITRTKGLLNGPGQNNCFLNSAVQVLWHLDIFRRSFRELVGHTCMADSCIFCALKALFAEFQYSHESALPPDALRRALAETFFNQQRFQLGFMDDAAECFENILLRIHFHIASAESEDMCSARHCISHQKFAMTLVEQSVCHDCGATSEPLPFTQMVHYVSASALCAQHKLMCEDPSSNMDNFGQLLRKAGGMGDFRACPSACGTQIQICRTLMNRPDIVSVGVVWDSERPTLDHIMDVFHTIGSTIRLQDVFHSVVDDRWASLTTHHLVGVVTYYGKHYSTFFFHTKLRVWIYFDDATVREVGPKWEQVIEKCRRGHFQPLLLLYSNPNGSAVSTDTAPRNVTLAEGQKRNVAHDIFHNERGNRGGPHHGGYTALQRRAITPNPERQLPPEPETSPRRAVTPNPELYNHEALQMRPSNGNGQPDHQCPPSYNVYERQKAMQQHQGLPQYPEAIRAPYRQGASRPPMLNLGPKPNSSENLLSEVHPRGMQTADAMNSAYINRKTVENVLSFQKMQWQRSSIGPGSSSVGSRGSSSSLESFETAIRLRGSQYPPNSPQEVVPDVARFRDSDSGNWSGDRNSASSSSSASLENPYYHLVGGGKRGVPTSPGGPFSKPGPDGLRRAPYDAGYDSYSLSSNDSFPLAQLQAAANGHAYHHLSQIPENSHNMHHQMVQNHPMSPSDTGNGSNSNRVFFEDDCQRLCTEADKFLARSMEREDDGDLESAISLCNNAAAKARAAMDAPYSNTQILVSARMKHNTCVMRARSLHRRLLLRQESLNSQGSCNSQDSKQSDDECEVRHSRQSSRDSTRSRHSRQSSRDGGNASHSRQGSRDGSSPANILAAASGTGTQMAQLSHSRQGSRDLLRACQEVVTDHKHIEIYATLPKRGVPKTIEKTRTGSVRVKSPSQLPETFLAPETRLSKTNSFVDFLRPPKETKKKDDRPDTDYSDYASEWEQTKRSSLQRSNSTGPAIVNGSRSFTDLTRVIKEPEVPLIEKAPPTIPGKKQHKIRRKLLMGGLIRRKNRSMPDLREGQGTDNAAATPVSEQRSFDDSTLGPSCPLQCSSEAEMGYLSDAHLNYQNIGSVGDRRLYSSHGKIPPPPPVRTTSQLTSRSHSQSNLTHRMSPGLPQYINVRPNQNRVTVQAEVHHERTASDIAASPNAPNAPPPPPLPKQQQQRDVVDGVAQSNLLAELQACRKKMLDASDNVHVPLENRSKANNVSSDGWLRELQAKQMAILQRRQETVPSGVNAVPAQILQTQTCETEVRNTVRNVKPAEPVRDILPNKTFDSNVIGGPSYAPKSVRDLASRFEQAKSMTNLHQVPRDVSPKPLQIARTSNTVDASLNRSDMKIIDSVQEPLTAPLCPPPYIAPPCQIPLQASQRHNVAPLNPNNSRGPPPPYSAPRYQNAHSQMLEPPLRKPQMDTSTTYRTMRPQEERQLSNLYVPYTTQGFDALPSKQEFVMKNSLNNGHGMGFHQQQQEQCTVDKEQIDTGILSDRNTPKKRKGKKSVTFSDQIALVASADDILDRVDFPNNPLWEKVMKTKNSVTGQTNGYTHEPQMQQQQQQPPIMQRLLQGMKPMKEVAESLNGNPDGGRVPCHLCRKKTVQSPTVYCPDCDFYMSRFRPKT